VKAWRSWMSFETFKPVTGFSFRVGYSEDQYEVRFYREDNCVRKLWHKAAPERRVKHLIVEGHLSNMIKLDLDCIPKTMTKPFAAFLIVGYRREKFSPCVRIKANPFHLSKLFASAKTWEAGTGCRLPILYPSYLRSTSASHAASRSLDVPPLSELSRRSARNARSASGNLSASCSILSRTVGMCHLLFFVIIICSLAQRGSIEESLQRQR